MSENSLCDSLESLQPEGLRDVTLKSDSSSYHLGLLISKLTEVKE